MIRKLFQSPFFNRPTTNLASFSAKKDINLHFVSLNLLKG